METPRENREGFISKYLHGGYSLPLSFWAFGLSIQAACYLAGYMLGYIFVNTPFLRGVLAIACIIELVLKFLFIIGVWNSGKYYHGSRIWVFLSRAFSILFLIPVLIACVAILS